MPPFLCATDAAKSLTRELGRQIRPRDVSDLLYQHPELSERCLWAAGRRLLPRELLPELRRAFAAKPTRKPKAG